MFRFPLAGRELFCLELSGLSLDEEIDAGSFRGYVIMALGTLGSAPSNQGLFIFKVHILTLPQKMMCL